MRSNRVGRTAAAILLFCGAVGVSSTQAAARVGCYSGGYTYAYAYCNVQACSPENQKIIYVTKVRYFAANERIDPLMDALKAEVLKTAGGEHFYYHSEACFATAETAASQGYEARRGSAKDKIVKILDVKL